MVREERSRHNQRSDRQAMSIGWLRHHTASKKERRRPSRVSASGYAALHENYNEKVMSTRSMCKYGEGQQLTVTVSRRAAPCCAFVRAFARETVPNHVRQYASARPRRRATFLQPVCARRERLENDRSSVVGHGEIGRRMAAVKAEERTQRDGSNGRLRCGGR